jgi:hypothetical protein
MASLRDSVRGVISDLLPEMNTAARQERAVEIAEAVFDALDIPPFAQNQKREAFEIWVLINGRHFEVPKKRG